MDKETTFTSVSCRKTGLVYDERMTEHKCLWDSNYPECPERFVCVLDRCKKYGLTDRCREIKPREATNEELLTLHTEDRLEILQSTDGNTDLEALEKLCTEYDSIFIHPSSNKLARLAAGSTIEMVDAIMDREVQNGMAIIRPPGHHAMKDEYCGYCFFNNIAVAAQHALEKKGASKVLIVDWDVHHGQATQQMFYDDPRVMYFSIHRYEKGAYWPHLRESDFHYIGEGSGYGYNVNIPLNKTGMGDTEYMAIFHQVLLPLAYEYSPDLVLVSAGFDSALGDPKGEMEVTPACYAHLTSSIMGLAGGKVGVVLEGGYNLEVLAEGAALTLRALLGDPCPAIGILGVPNESIQESMLSAIYMLRPVWKCFQYQGSAPARAENLETVRAGRRFCPTIEFHGLDEKPASFPTRDFHCAPPMETLRALEKRLQDLILGTSLSVPTQRVCLIEDTPNLLEDRNLVDRCHRLTAQKSVATDSLVQMVDSILDGVSRSAIAIIDTYDQSRIGVATEHAVLVRKLDRVLVINCNVRCSSTASQDVEDDSRILTISININGVDEAPVQGRESAFYNVNIIWTKEGMGESEDMAAFLQIVLPIAYQYNPQLVMLVAAFDPESQSTAAGFAQMMHLLTPLAQGRLALIFEKSDIERASLCCSALLGDPLPKTPTLPLHPTAGQTLRRVLSVYRPFWSRLAPSVDLPEENVLCPGLIADPKVFQDNKNLSLEFTARLHRFAQDQRSLKLD